MMASTSRAARPLHQGVRVKVKRQAQAPGRTVQAGGAPPHYPNFWAEEATPKPKFRFPVPFYQGMGVEEVKRRRRRAHAPGRTAHAGRAPPRYRA